MGLTNKEAFRLGFLARCAEEGLTGADLDTRIKKAWFGPLAATAALGTGAAVASAAHQSLPTLIGLPAALGLVGGGLAGHTIAKVTEPDVDEDDIKAQELADTYKIYAQRAAAKQKYRQYRPARVV